MNRSSWASGSSKVPLCSIGFWVAITRNGAGSLKVSLPIVTRRSCIASSKALCTLGAARLISSASSRFVKIGPLCTRKSLVRWSRISEPMMSEGSRSTVNWMRAKWRSIVLDRTATKQRLGQARHALKQQVAAGEEGDQQPLDDHVLADHHGPHPLADRADELERLGWDLPRTGGARRRMIDDAHDPKISQQEFA